MVAAGLPGGGCRVTTANIYVTIKKMKGVSRRSEEGVTRRSTGVFSDYPSVSLVIDQQRDKFLTSVRLTLG